jgi:peptidylprolyl isomerase
MVRNLPCIRRIALGNGLGLHDRRWCRALLNAVNGALAFADPPPHASLLAVMAVATGCWPVAAAQAAPTTAEVLAAAPASAWRALPPDHTLYLDLPSGRVVIELEPALAPHTVAAVERLARSGYFNGLAVTRVQDNYVAQWGDAESTQRLPEGFPRSIAPEFTAPLAARYFVELPGPDGFAPQAGFVDGFPAGRDPRTGQAWLAHCYGAVGVGRDDDPASGIGTELYAVIGHAPRHLDRNITVVGRVRQGIELLSSLPRGPAPMGFYTRASERVPISGLRVAADLPAGEQLPLQVLRTDTATFAALVESRRNRREAWFHQPAGYIDLCNVPIPVRAAP